MFLKTFNNSAFSGYFKLWTIWYVTKLYLLYTKLQSLISHMISRTVEFSFFRQCETHTYWLIVNLYKSNTVVCFVFTWSHDLLDY